MKVLLGNSERALRGGELQTLALARGLEALGCEVVVAARRGGALIDAARGVRCEAFRFESPPLETPVELARLIARWRPDVVHAQTSAAHSHLWLARRLLRSAPPLVVSRRVAFRVRRDPLSLLKYRTGVAHYIPISRAAARGLEAAGVRASAMTVVPSGVDVAAFRASRGDERLRHEWGIERAEAVIGAVGAFEREKGHEVLLDAALSVLERRPGARFVLVGDGRLRPSFERAIARSALAGNAICVTQSAPLETILPLFDLFVLPSLEEGLSSALLAAMAAGLPIVASDVGGIPEAVTPECALLVPPGDRAALAAAIVRAVEDVVLRRRMAEASRARAELFDTRIMTARVHEIYRRVTGAGRAESETLGQRGERGS